MRMNEQQAEARFAEILTERGLATCPDCGRRIDRGDVAWNSGETEAGTGYSDVHIICQECGRAIARIQSWYSDIPSFEECVEMVLDSSDEEWLGD